MNWKEEYIKYLGKTSLTIVDIQTAQDIKIKNLPKKLYKYRAVNDFSIQNLIEDSVWLNKPSQYNDPYEFYESMNIDLLLKEMNHAKFEEILSSFSHKVNLSESIIKESKLKDDPFSFLGAYILRQGGYSEDKIKMQLEILDKMVKEQMQSNAMDRLKLMQDSMVVCSFCESPKQLLMWSHYADSHRGICIEYNIESWENDDLRKRLLFPVMYQNEFYDSTNHILNYIKNGEFNNLYPIIAGSTKSKDWEHEQEWRFLIQAGDFFAPQNYRMNCQTRVFLGAKISTENRERVSVICKEKSIGILESKISVNNHTLEFTTI
jgi:Protein of unknown function (DUF2971)